MPAEEREAVSDESVAKKRKIAEYFSGISAPDYGVDARFFPAMGRRLVERAHIPEGARVLDVAAGRGAILFPARSEERRVGKECRL